MASRRSPAPLPCGPRTRRRPRAGSPSTRSCGWSSRFFQSPPHCLVTDGLNDPQFHHLPSEQAQCPVGITRGRRPQSGRNDPRLLLAVEQLLDRRSLALAAVKRLPKAALDEALPDILDGLDSAPERLSDTAIGPVRSLDIGPQEDLGATNLLCGPLQLLDHGRQLVPLLGRQSDEILLVHEQPPWSAHDPRFRTLLQPQLLAVTKH